MSAEELYFYPAIQKVLLDKLFELFPKSSFSGVIAERDDWEIPDETDSTNDVLTGETWYEIDLEKVANEAIALCYMTYKATEYFLPAYLRLLISKPEMGTLAARYMFGLLANSKPDQTFVYVCANLTEEKKELLLNVLYYCLPSLLRELKYYHEDISDAMCRLHAPQGSAEARQLTRKIRAREIQDAIAAILLRDWDPIGIQNEPMCQHEYYAYVGGVYHLLGGQATVEQVAEHLGNVESAQIGTQTTTEHRLAVARKLCALNVDL